MRKLALILLAAILSLSSLAEAHAPSRPADNAALRYWMAFALMNDAPISKEATARLDAVLAGTDPWDEQKFGALIDQNKEALDTMTRGTRLPYCDWGTEYDLGPDAPVAHLPKARALARLNVLNAKREASAGDYAAAVQSTSAGIHFARHLAQNASFIGALTAKTALVADLEEARQLAQSGRLSPQDVDNLQAAMKALPAGGFDWANAVQIEGQAMHDAMMMMARSADPKALYKTWFGDPAPDDFRVPSAKDLSGLDHAMAQFARLLELPPDTAKAQVEILQKQINALDPFTRMMVPNPARIVASRAEVIAMQQETRKALGE